MVLYLFDEWATLEKSLSRARTLYLFSDFDGTLAPITRRPELTRLDDKGRDLLARLVSNKRFKVALISGRSADQLRRMVGVDGICYVGNHGFEIMGPRVRFRHPAAIRKIKFLESATAKLRMVLTPIHGVIIEDKKLSVSIHYRLVKPSLREHVFRAVKSTVEKYGGLKLTSGKMVLEIRPRVKWHKGIAALRLSRALGKRGKVIYIGDDMTDEDAFRSLRGSTTIRVTNKRIGTNARYYVRSVGEVWRLMSLLVNMRFSHQVSTRDI